MNPFDDVILLAPRLADAAIDCGLNSETLSALIQDFEALVEKKTSPGTRLVLSPQHGYGKSHLLGRLFQRLSERATCIYLTPYADPSAGWRAVLNAVVDELCQAQNYMTASQGEHVVAQMEFFAFNVLLSLVEKRRTERRMTDEQMQAHAFLTSPTMQFTAWLMWLESSGVLDALGGELRRAGFDLQPSSQAWVQVLFHYARAEKDDDLRHDVIDWLRGRPLEDEQRERLGLRAQDCPDVEASRPALNALARERLSMLCRLSRFHLPLLICFDQIESFCHEPALTRSFGNMVCELSNAQDAAGPSFPNQSVVVTANQLEWEGVIKPALYPAELQRFRPQHALYLQPPTRAQAQSLVSLRLERANCDAQVERQFVEGPWFEACFQGERAAFGVRDFLLRCRQQWGEFERHRPKPHPQPAQAPQPLTSLDSIPSIPDLLGAEDEAWDILVEDIPGISEDDPAKTAANLQALLYKHLDAAESALKRRDGALRFDADALTWTVGYFGRAVAGVKVALQSDKSNYIHTIWSTGNDAWIGFITEDNNHWRRWRVIREDAQRRCAAQEGAKVVALRTVDLSPLPGPNWASEGDPFRQAGRRFLDVVVIDRSWLARIYGAREVIREVEQGKIEVDGGAEAAMAILSPLLEPLWARLRAPLPVEGKTLPAVPSLAQSREQAPQTPAATAMSLTVSELLRAIRSNLEPPRQPSANEAADAGVVFHACARALHDGLTKHPEAPPTSCGANALWAFFTGLYNTPPWARLPAPRAADVEAAARALCAHLAALGRGVGAWSDLLLEAELERARVYQPSGQTSTVRLNGRVDALRKTPHWDEVVDYKLRAEPKPEDAYQVAAYAWLLGATPGDPNAPRIGARVEYFTPDLAVQRFTPEQLLALIADDVEPTLHKWLHASPASEPQASEQVVQVLAAYGLDVELIGDPIEAPQVQRLLLKPCGKTTVKQIEQRSSDLKVKLSLREIPMIEPGQGSVYLDIPRAQARVVPWDALQFEWCEQNPTASNLALPLALGVDNQPITLDLSDASQCHVLIAGTSGSGKSELLRSILASLVSRNTPESLRVTLIDPKRITFASMAGSPFLERGEVIFELQPAIDHLEALVEAMQRTYKTLEDTQPTTSHVIIVDEFANLVTDRALSKRFTTCVQDLAAMGRAARFHLILATQYPPHQVISSTIKTNLPVRICLKMPSGKNAQMVMDQTGAENLLGKGDLLCAGLSGRALRGQAPLIRLDVLRALLQAPQR